MTEPIQVGEVYRGRYRVLAALGEGGTAVVYRLQDFRLGRNVCLKKARPRAPFTLDQLRPLFANEARVLTQLEGQFAPRLFEFREDDLELYMELCPGQALDAYYRQRLGQGTPLEQAQVLRLVEELGRALAYCHARGVLLTDLKPQNVLLAGGRAAGEVAVRLIDFGSARLSAAAAAGPATYSAGYGAPELLRGEAPTAAADVYSLGAILFAWLARREPGFDELPRDFGAQARSVDPRLRELVYQMTAASPGDRPTLAAVLPCVAELRDLLALPPSERVRCPNCKEEVPPYTFCPRCRHRLRRGGTQTIEGQPRGEADAARQLRQAFAAGRWLDVLFWAGQADRRGVLDDAGVALAVTALARLPRAATFASDLEQWRRLGAQVEPGALPAERAREFLVAWGELLRRAGAPLAPFRAWFQGGTQRWPEEAALWSGLAEASAAADREGLLRQGLARCPESAALRRELGEVLARSGRPADREEALDLWSEAVARGERDLPFLRRAYELARQCRDAARCEVLRRQILSTPGTSAGEYLELALFARSEGQAAQALALAEAGLALDPVHEALKKLKAQLLFDQGKYELLLEYLEGLAADTDVLLLRGVARFELRRFAEAAKDLEGALKANWRVPVAWRDLVLCYRGMNQLERARQVLEGARQLLPDDPGLAQLAAGPGDESGPAQGGAR